MTDRIQNGEVKGALGGRNIRALSFAAISGLLLLTTLSPSTLAQPSPTVPVSKQPSPPSAASPNPVAMTPGPPPGQASAEELQELVSPIALYPDLLVAQILVASTYPDQIVECDVWLKRNPNLSGDRLATAVNAQPWDPSVKSLSQFPQVVRTMSESLAWTSALGEAYYNQPADVMAAVQAMRGRAVDAGTLKSSAQQKVEVQHTTAAPAAAEGGEQPVSQQQTVVIQPAQPNVVYVPQYNPSAAYGAPVQTPQGYTGSEMLMTGLLSFGTGIALGALINEGDNDWDCDWHGGGGGYVNYNRNVYVNNPRVPPRGNYAGGYTRATPSARAGTRSPNTSAGPSTRPYNRDNARRYAEAGSSFSKPSFPQPNSLGGSVRNPNAAGSRTRQQPGGLGNRSAQAGNRPVAKQASASRPATANRSAQQMRGYAGGRNPAGNRTGAFGGYQAGGSAQASSRRGRSSFNGRSASRGGSGGFHGGGGGAARAGGGGGRARGGGGRRR